MGSADGSAQSAWGGVAPALLVDLYELTMAYVYWQTGMCQERATFSLFTRQLPANRGFLVAAGLDDALDWLEQLRFDGQTLQDLEALQLFPVEFLDWLGELRFTGDVRAVDEGTLVFAAEPLLEVDAPMAEAQLAETFLLNQLTLQTTLATKAARCLHAARDRGVSDFGLRHAQGIDAGMKLSRVCKLVGIDTTSNVAGARRYGLQATGTMAHSFVQAHQDERESFLTFARAFGPSTTLLVDTYDSARAIELVVDVAQEIRREGGRIYGIRLDSGDLLEQSSLARRRFDESGLGELRVVASGGLDEYKMERLLEQGAPIDGFGVGSALAVSADAPLTDMVYKLVEYAGRPVHKLSPGKVTWPGRKQVWRAQDWSHDLLALADEPAPAESQPLLRTVVRSGRRLDPAQQRLEQGRQRFADQWGHLPEAQRRLKAPAAYPVRTSSRLRELARALSREELPKSGNPTR